VGDDPILTTYKGLAFALAAVMVMGLGYWMLAPGGGPEEFARAQQALRNARSWRLQYSGREGNMPKAEMTAEISCPNLHLLRRMTNAPEGAPLTYQEFLIRGENGYYREGPEEEWRVGGEMWELEHLCAQAAGGGGNPRFMPSWADLLRGRANIVKGERKTIAGVNCRVWQVKYLLEAERYLNEDICIGTDDHLARERITSTGRFAYADWNADIAILAPDRVRPREPH